METIIIETFEQGYKQVYQSEILNNGEFDYRLYVTILNLNECSDIKGFGVDVEIAKTKKELTKKQKQEIVKSFCLNSEKEISDYDVLDYGYRAILDGQKKIIKTEKKALEIAETFLNKLELYKCLIGFYLDKPQNRIGNTGWDLLNGKIGF